jgi:ligand-binding sensor domain-containing protein
MLKKPLFIAILAIACAIAHGQAPYFKNYQVRDGLPSNNVYFVFQDTKGYIWLCTDVGVSRFDGAHFTNYTTTDGLTDNEVFTCFEDREGRIWFATLNGKPCFFQQGKMHNEADTPLLRDFNMEGLIVHIYQEETDELVMASTKQFGKLDMAKNKALRWPSPYGTIQIWNEPGSSVGILTNQKLGFMDGGLFTQTSDLDGVKLPLKHVQSGDVLYVVFARKLVIYNLKAHQVIRETTLPNAMTEAIFVAIYGDRLWIGDRNGAFLFDRNTLEQRQLYLPKSQVSAVLEDREGGWWFSTLEQGVFYVPTPEILQYSTSIGEQPLRINCLASDANGRLWLGMNESAYGMLEGNHLKVFQEYPKGLKPRAINSIRHFPDGSTMLAGKAGVLKIKGSQRSFYRLRSSDLNLDHDGNLWVGLTGLFFVAKQKIDNYDLFSKTVEEGVEPAVNLANPPENRSKLRVDKIVFDEINAAWLASPNGLFRYQDGTMSTPILPHPTRDLLLDEKTQTTWALTESNGLFMLRNGQVLDSIRIGNAQGPVICRSLCMDEQGDHWLATASGLFKVAGQPGSLRLFDFSNFYGMGAEKLNAVAVLNGQVFMGKDDALMAAPIPIFSKKTPPPPVYLTGLVAKGRAVPLFGQPLNFGFDENSISFNFEGLSFKDFKNLHYRYRLQGHDTDWHSTANEAVEYASLRPGQYRFEVLAVNNSGVESTKPAVLEFTINKPFWMKWWFVLGMLALVAALVWLWVKQRERKLRRKFELQQQLMETENEKLELQKKNADLKMLALRLQMNPHFIFNALNTIKGYYGQEKFTQANSYIAKFARLLRLNLDYSDTYIPLDQEIELLKIYMQLSQIRYPDKMDFQVEVAQGIVPSSVLIPSMVIQPFVENAVIHGIVGKLDRGQILLHFAKNEAGEIVVKLKDDGIGRKAAAVKHNLRDPHKPLATAITQERLELLRKKGAGPAVEIFDIYDENGQAAGTEVLLRLPMETIKS